MKIKVNIPIVAYSDVTVEIDAPDDMNLKTGESKSCPHFNLVDVMLEVPESNFKDQPVNWGVDAASLDDGVESIGDWIVKG